jgi:cell division protein FtsZ
MSTENKSSELIPFKFPLDTGKIIKAIGVGGGGGNAVKHMYEEGIHDVSFVLCNTDKQHMEDSDVPVKIVLGPTVTKGLGAGNDPKKGEEAARESAAEIRAMLNDGTQMVFITAAMGGGTGTGSAPVIAGIARKMNILTVGIVTLPFLFEGYDKINQALDGMEEISNNVDALLVVNNERLNDNISDISVEDAFAKADDTLTVAAKSISELITLRGKINLDFADVNTTLKNGGIALMSAGYGTGENRLEMAIKDSLNSPLLRYNDIGHAKKILFQIASSDSKEFKLRIKELQHIRRFMKEFEQYIKVIWGLAYDNSLGEKVKFTILVSGFGLEEVQVLTSEERKDISNRQEIRKKMEDKEKEERIKKFYDLKNELEDLMSRIAILTGDEMDDNAFICWLEEHPVCDRTPEEIAGLREKKMRDVAPVRQPVASPEAGGNKIRF